LQHVYQWRLYVESMYHMLIYDLWYTQRLSNMNDVSVINIQLLSCNEEETLPFRSTWSYCYF